MKFKATLLLFLSIGCATSVSAQKVNALTTDTIKISAEVEDHSPKKATIMSLALPGLGQAYNKKYWKIPIVYAMIVTPLFFAIDQQQQFNEFKSAYLKRVDGNPNTADLKYKGVYSDNNLLSLIDFHRKNRDLFYVLTGVAYVLNVVDAAVDAHLYYFNVSDDISAIVKPDVQYFAQDRMLAPSLTLSFTFGSKPPLRNF